MLTNRNNSVIIATINCGLENEEMQYQVFNHTIVLENENIKTYGIVLYVNNCEVLRIYDVSTDYQAIIKFVDSINEKHLDPFKLGESLEEFININ